MVNLRARNDPNVGAAMIRCHRCAAAIWARTHVPGHPDEACRGHLEQQALLADGWVSLTPYIPFRPGREETIAAQFPERREGPLLVAVIGGFGPRWDVIYRSWYVRGGRVEVRTGDLVGAIAVELTRAPDDGAYVAGNVLSWSAEAVGRTLDPDGLSITATCGSRLHRLRFAEGRLEALDHDPAELADEGRRWTAGRCGELLDLWGSGEWAAAALDMTQEDSDYQRVDVKAVELLPLLQPLTAAARAHLVTAMDRYGVGTVFRVLDVALCGEDRAPAYRPYGNLVPCADFALRPSWVRRVPASGPVVVDGRFVLDVDRGASGGPVAVATAPVLETLRGLPPPPAESIPIDLEVEGRWVPRDDALGGTRPASAAAIVAVRGLPAQTGDRARGVLLGLAAGDRNGGPLEMALELAESLLKHRAFDPGAVLARYLRWYRERGFDTGPVAAQVFGLIAAGIPPDRAVEATHAVFQGRTAGCNPAHRVVPVAAAGFVDDAAVALAACRDARLTHFHHLASEVAATTASLCRLLVNGSDWAEALDAVGVAVPEENGLSAGGFAPDVLGAAVFFVDRYAAGPVPGSSEERYSAVLQDALDFAGPDNYCPVLAGAIAGALWGATSIDEALLSHVGVPRERLERVAGALAATW